MNKSTAGNARLGALSLLNSVFDEHRNLVEAGESGPPMESRDRAYAKHLAYGVLRWQVSLEWLANQLLRRPLKRKDREVQRLILIGLYQLWQDNSAPHAAINETAECARKIGKSWAVALVNAVLRRFQREQAEWLARLGQTDARYAHPPWLLERLRLDWPDDWKDIVNSNNRAPPLWLRLNASHPRGDLVHALEQSDLSLQEHPWVGSAVRVDPAVPVGQLPGFGEGRTSVQDPAAQLAAGLLDLRDGLRVLDACAAPGGKSCHILERAPGVELTAVDRSPARLDLVRDNLRRIGFGESPRVRLLAEDAAKPDAWWDGAPYDRILLDAPCTSTGVIRRHPEIKYLRTPEQVKDSVKLQSRLLDRLWPLLDTGGILLYATCSVLKDENDRQIKQFLERTRGAEVLEFDGDWGRPVTTGRQILPGDFDMDGFFYARLRKHF